MTWLKEIRDGRDGSNLLNPQKNSKQGDPQSDYSPRSCSITDKEHPPVLCIWLLVTMLIYNIYKFSVIPKKMYFCIIKHKILGICYSLQSVTRSIVIQCTCVTNLQFSARYVHLHNEPLKFKILIKFISEFTQPVVVIQCIHVYRITGQCTHVQWKPV